MSRVDLFHGYPADSEDLIIFVALYPATNITHNITGF
jgi:hypothetical protein